MLQIVLNYSLSLKEEKSIKPSSITLCRFILTNYKRVEMEVDTKIPNAATFAIEREDHTLGNILRG
jgi:hypothetical protein